MTLVSDGVHPLISNPLPDSVDHPRVPLAHLDTNPAHGRCHPTQAWPMDVHKPATLRRLDSEMLQRLGFGGPFISVPDGKRGRLSQIVKRPR